MFLWDTFAKCGPHGDSKPGSREYDLNPYKNRSSAPKSIDRSITLDSILKRGDDTHRFRNEQAATITGYVALVKDGGSESCNCGSKVDKDTHIALVANPKDADDSSKHVVVEVTPAFRKLGTTTQIKAKFLHHWATFTGWLMYDAMHKPNAVNTNPKGNNLWRATCTELHPVTAIAYAR